MPDTPPQKDGLNWVPIISLALASVVGLLLYLKGGDPTSHLKVLTGYVTLILVFFYGFMVLVDMVRGKIDLSKLVSEQDGTASISRFQLLIFTFVIALSFVLLVVSDSRFPAIPNEVLILLGISASTYGVSKGIQKSAEVAAQNLTSEEGAAETAPDQAAKAAQK